MRGLIIHNSPGPAVDGSLTVLTVEGIIMQLSKLISSRITEGGIELACEDGDGSNFSVIATKPGGWPREADENGSRKGDDNEKKKEQRHKIESPSYDGARAHSNLRRTRHPREPLLHFHRSHKPFYSYSSSQRAYVGYLVWTSHRRRNHEKCSYTSRSNSIKRQCPREYDGGSQSGRPQRQ